MKKTISGKKNYINNKKATRTIIAVIPARKGSKRFPGKNTALLKGKPLVTHTIEIALKTEIFSKICVTTDDPDVMAIAKEKKVTVIERPKELCGDAVLVDKTVLNVMGILEDRKENYDAVCLMTPTAPLRTVDDVTGAVRLLWEKNADFVITVTKYDHNPYHALAIQNGVLKPNFMADVFFKDPWSLPVLYRPLAVARVGRWEAVKRHGTIFGPGMISYIIPADHAVDIDNPIDLKWAEFLLKERINSSKLTEAGAK